MSRLSAILTRFFGDPQKKEAPSLDYLFLERRTIALKALESYGMHAHYYIPSSKIDDPELVNACRFLVSSGYIITDMSGRFVGKLARVEYGSGALTYVNAPDFQIRQKMASKA